MHHFYFKYAIICVCLVKYAIICIYLTCKNALKKHIKTDFIENIYLNKNERETKI